MKTPLGIKLSDVQKAVSRARLARDMHAGECTLWDYEGSDCVDCVDTENALAKARTRLLALEDK